MPSELPPLPNFEHLRKQAKSLLNEYREEKPQAKARLEALGLSPRRAARLADAQRAVAREYGFASWAKLKKHVEAAAAENANPLEQIKHAFRANDAATVAALLECHPPLRAGINDPALAFGATPILCAAQRGRREMIDVLLRYGADINARSDWWAGGFGILDTADPDLAAFLIERGARVDAHAAARLGMIDRLKDLVSANPELVHARGGDGKLPLHCASTIEIAEYLLDHGAEIDARDIDHESTAAQYMVASRPDVARFLISRGCKTDILMAAAVDDLDLVRRHLSEDPQSIRTRVSDEYFPMVREKGGGTIYQWELGWYVSAHQVARKFDHEAVFKFLMEHTPADEKLLVACWLHDRELVKPLLSDQPDLARMLPGAARRHPAHAGHNNDTAAVGLMLDARFPVDARGRHGATPLHWAGFHGNDVMASIILRHSPPLEQTDDDFKSTPLGWAIHGSEHGWNSSTGDYAATVRLLLDAGAKPPEKLAGTPAVRQELRRHGVKDTAST
ncbi:MAG TPA: ankyrin repeat domain-containing protein [Tepidisphaeraceae bacterium]|nr:ankyrin repeat domain-containing protein [Tepidisphaeraceae bacterium]